MFLKACSNMVVISKRPRCGLLLRPSLGTNAVLAPGGDHRTRIVLIALVWLCGGCFAPFARISGIDQENFMRIHLRYCSK